jgi:hypothetical protein
MGMVAVVGRMGMGRVIVMGRMQYAPTTAAITGIVGNDDNAMYVIGHYNKYIYLNIGTYVWRFQPFIICNFFVFV